MVNLSMPPGNPLGCLVRCFMLLSASLSWAGDEASPIPISGRFLPAWLAKGRHG